MMNKKAGERYLFPVMLVVWTFIGLSVTAGFFIFYSAKVDVRLDEAEILAERVVDCIADNGYLKEEFLQKDLFLDKCNLEKTIVDGEDYYLRLYFESGFYQDDLVFGNKDFEMKCRLKENAEVKGSAECYRKNFYLLNEDDERVELEILSASNNLGRKL